MGAYSDDKKQTVSRIPILYILPQIDRFGQLGGELFWLRNAFPQSEFEITLVTYPPETRSRTNNELYRIATRGLNIHHSVDENLIWSTHADRAREAYQENGVILHLYDSRVLKQFVLRYVESGNISFYFALNEDEKRRGKAIENAFGIPEGSPVVTLHAREGGYLPDLSYHSYRDVDIESYFPAIDYLIERGYYVIRLGDKSMKRFVNPPKELVDAPFHPAYEQLVDPYFIARSKFFIGCSSGPTAVAQGFGIPQLHLNTSLQPMVVTLERDLVVPRNYYSEKLNRNLTFAEILSSPLIDFTKTEHYQFAGIQAVQNTTEEILAAVVEMEARIDGTFGNHAEIEKLNKRTKETLDFANTVRLVSNPEKPIYMALLSSSFSLEFAKRNPGYF